MVSTLRTSVFICLLLAACNSRPSKNISGTKPYGSLDTASWIIGVWESRYGDLYMCESWIRRNDSTITGFSFALKDKDTVFSESLNLEIRNGKLRYVPAVAQQNGGKPVVFTADSAVSPNAISFSNLTHDFPQKITYHRINHDSILAEISGHNSQGTFRSQQFPMKRIKH